MTGDTVAVVVVAIVAARRVAATAEMAAMRLTTSSTKAKNVNIGEDGGVAVAVVDGVRCLLLLRCEIGQKMETRCWTTTAELLLVMMCSAPMAEVASTTMMNRSYVS